MIAHLRTYPEAGVVGCRLLNEDGTIQWSVKSLPNPGSALFGARSFMSRIFPGNRFTRKHLLHLGRDMTTPFITVDGYVSSASVDDAPQGRRRGRIPRHKLRPTMSMPTTVRELLMPGTSAGIFRKRL